MEKIINQILCASDRYYLFKIWTMPSCIMHSEITGWHSKGVHSEKGLAHLPFLKVPQILPQSERNIIVRKGSDIDST